MRGDEELLDGLIKERKFADAAFFAAATVLFAQAAYDTSATKRSLAYTLLDRASAPWKMVVFFIAMAVMIYFGLRK